MPSTHAFVIAFASASAELNDIVDRLTLQCLNVNYPLFSTPVEVPHLFRVHPAQSLSTRTVNVFVLSVAHRQLGTRRGRRLRYRAILLTFHKLTIVGIDASRINSFVADVVLYLISTVHWHSPASEQQSRWL